MRYLPLDASEREAMLARIGVPDIEALFADIPADKRIQGLLDMPLAKSEMAVERAMTTIAGRSLAAGSAPFFLGAGAYRRHIPATRRSSHPAFRIPDQLHPLSAGNRPGDASGPVRVPDPGRRAHRHGGRQRLDVRRLDRLRRGDADGPPADAAQQGGALRRPASAICRRLRDAGAYGGRHDRPSASRPQGERRHRRRRSTTRRAASSSRRPTSSAIRAISRLSPPRRTRAALS